MRSCLATVLAFGWVSLCVVGCGSGGAVNFYQAAGGSAGRSSTAGDLAGGGSAGSAVVGSAGAGGTVAAGGSDAAGGNSGPSDAPCSPATEGTNGASGPFGTTGPACWRVSMDITGWGCSNMDGRTVSINGTPAICAQLPLPDKLNGDYYFSFTAGTFDYASFYWY